MACFVSPILPKKSIKIIALICAILFVFGLTGLISVNTAVKKAAVSNTEESVHTISKLTTNTVFFDVDGDVKSWSLDDTNYILVKKATDEYSNVVIKTITDKDVDWLIDFKTQSVKYVVYLDSELYERYKNPNILYERG